MDLTVIVPNHDQESEVKEVAMGGKHQRSLSLSAKWANDKAMAVEYLRRQREVLTWIESVLKRGLPTTDLYEALKSGVVLRETMETLFPDVSNCMSPISRNYNKRMAPWKERENISVFLRQCKSIGMYDLSLFCTDDLYEGTNMVQVLFCIQHFMLFSEEHADHHFKAVNKNQPAEFSNQELEMAMSKLIQASVDAKSLQGLMSSASAAQTNEEETVMCSSDPLESAENENAKDEEPAKSEEGTEEKLKVEVETEVCNQVSEDKEVVETPADDAETNPEQEESADEDEEVAGVSALEQEVVVADEEPASAEDVETIAAIQQVLLDMASAIEEAEEEAKRQALATEACPIETEALPVQTTTPPALIPEATVAMVEAESETVEEVNIEVEVPANNLEQQTDTPLEPTAPTDSAKEEANVQPEADSATKEATEEAKEQQQDANDEELEAKAMAKCTCGSSCAIM